MRPWLTAAALVVLTGCVGEDAPSASPPTTAPTATTPAATAPGTPTGTPSPVPTVTPSGPFSTAAVVLRPAEDGEPVPLAVHVAAEPETRQRGLMGRTEVPAGTGMLFLFPEDTAGAFWMKDTLVPLSIAFATAGGQIVDVLQMEPCTAEPCELYQPDASYRMALEVPRGWFAEVGVGPGDRIEVPEDLPAPR